MGVEVRVLGPVTASVDGRPVDLGRRRQRAVLARLAMAGGAVVSTDRLLEDLWSGRADAGSQGSLQVAVSHLRRVLEPDRAPRSAARVLVSAAPGYALRLDPDDLDAARVGRLLERARGEEPVTAAVTLRAVLDLWRGQSYAEFVDADWATAEVARLDELLLSARERLAAVQLDLGAHHDVVPTMDRHVRAHPLREEGVRLLAVALYRSGRAPEALDLLRQTRERLREDLGLDPGAELVSLEADVLDRARHLAAAPTDDVRTLSPEPVTSQVGAREELLGRDDELARLEECAEGAAAGAMRLALVGGEAGAGKSALLDALVARLEGRGWASVRGRCPESDGAPPAWAWTEIAAGLGQEEGTDEPAADDTDPADSMTASTSRGAFRRARTIAEALDRAAARRPVVVTVDDLHRADDETLRLLRVIVSAAPARVFVVAAHRVEEASPGSALEATFAALATSITDRFVLSGLDGPAVLALLDRYGLDADPALTARVVDRTGGNPLFLREVARLMASPVTARSRGSAGRGGAAAPASAVAETAIPDGVRDVLRRRLATLSGRARSMLAHLALFGREAEVEVLLAFERAVDGGADEDEALDGLEAAVEAGVIVEVPDGRVGFAHDLWREVLDTDLPRLRRARLHATVLDVLEHQPDRRPATLSALAHHALAAGDRVALERTLGHVEVAAEQAVARGAYRTAAALLVRARDRAVAADGGVRRVAELRCSLVTALAGAGATGSALAERFRAVADARALGDPALLARAVTSVDAPVPWPDRGQSAELLGDVAVELLSLGDPDGWTPPEAVRTRLLVTAAMELEFSDPDRGDDLAGEAIDRARAAADTRLLCAALNARFLCSHPPRWWARLDELGTEMLDAARVGGHEDYRAQAHHVLFAAATARDDTAEAVRHIEAAVACAADGQLDTVLGYVGIFRATCALIDGDLDEAERRYRQETARNEAAGMSLARHMRVVTLYTVAHARGDTSASLPDLRWLDDAYPGAVDPMLVDALLDAGRVAEARALWSTRRPVPLEWSWHALTALYAHTAVRLGDRDAAEELHSALVPWSGRLGMAVGGYLVLEPIDLTLARTCRFLGRPEPERRHHLEIAERVAGRSAPWRARIMAER